MIYIISINYYFQYFAKLLKYKNLFINPYIIIVPFFSLSTCPTPAPECF